METNMETINGKKLVQIAIENSDYDTPFISRLILTNKNVLQIADAYQQTAKEIEFDICGILVSDDCMIEKSDFDAIIAYLGVNGTVKSMVDFDDYFKYSQLYVDGKKVVFSNLAEPLFDLYLAYVQKSMPDFEYDLPEVNTEIICSFNFNGW